jgi:2-polyprenyl-3-methyl-5-hydroxy-6-metoxy-1,4-benzoquinol methylase
VTPPTRWPYSDILGLFLYYKTSPFVFGAVLPGVELFMRCPICNVDAEAIRELKKPFIDSELSQYFNEDVPSDLCSVDYTLLRCPNCSLEFAAPSIPGSDRFYDWLCKRAGYYPSARWEWNVVLDEMTKVCDADRQLIEVGCGNGIFLEKVLRKFPGAKAFGLDASPKAVKEASDRGAKAFVGDVREFLTEQPERRKEFLFAVSFHCLEHVADPVSLVKAMLSLVSDHGRVFLSTPYSPLSLELEWFDILNHPPHHLTRWNSKSFAHLADACDAELRLLLPECSDSKTRALASNAVRYRGVDSLRSIKMQKMCAALHPLSYRRHLKMQEGREAVNGAVAADVVLAEFRPKKRLAECTNQER